MYTKANAYGRGLNRFDQNKFESYGPNITSSIGNVGLSLVMKSWPIFDDGIASTTVEKHSHHLSSFRHLNLIFSHLMIIFLISHKKLCRCRGTAWCATNTKIVPIWDWGHLLTLTLTSDDLESHIIVSVSSTLTNTTIWFVAALSLIVDVRTDVWTHGRTFLPGLLGHLSGDDLKSHSWKALQLGITFKVS